MPSGRARYPQPIDPERQPAHNRSESIRFARLEKIRTQLDSRVVRAGDAVDVMQRFPVVEVAYRRVG